MAEAISCAFVKIEKGYSLPREFGMFSSEGNAAVRGALAAFLAKAPLSARAAGLDTPAKRLAAFQDADVATTKDGQCYDAFFGHADEP